MSTMQNRFSIVNAMLYDGTGAKPFAADVSVENGRIVSVVPAGTGKTAGEAIDAGGCALAPGFIDVHSHSDGPVLRIPLGDSRVAQGITTEVIGNCGFTEFRAEGDNTDMDAYEALYRQARPSTNIATLIGHGTLRMQVMGCENRPASPAEIGRMRDLLARALEKGAAGMSSGLWYIPGKYSDTEEVCAVASALKGTTKPYATHMRSEDDTLLEAMEEAVTIARAGSNSLQISHFKTCGRANWHKIDAALALVEKYRAEGMDILADRYPYLYTETGLRMALPPPYDAIHNIRGLLQDNPDEQRKLVEAFRRVKELSTPWNKIIVIDSDNEAHAPYCGKTVADIGSMMSLTPEEAYVRLISQGTLHAAFGRMCVENLRRILACDWVVAGSDSSTHPFVSPICHPREFGTMARFFRLACETSAPEAVIRRMTSLPAAKFNLKDRGTVAPGFCADLVLFRPEQFDAPVDYAKPDQVPGGIEKVFVNGRMVYAAGTKNAGIEPGAGDFLRVF